jgi:putative ABC transport system permease protein
VQTRLDTLATLKCLGVAKGGAFTWFAIELLLLGAMGGVAGCCAGLLARRPLLWMARIGTPSATYGIGFLASEAILIGVALPEIMGFAWVLPAVRQRPAVLLHRETDQAFSSAAIQLRNLVSWVVFCAAAVLLIGKGWMDIAPLLAALGATLLVLNYLFQMGFRLAQRALAKRSMVGLPLSIRHGLKNFLRIESSNGVTTAIAALVAALAIIAALGQGMVVREVARSLPMSQANVYLMGFSHGQLAGIRSILDRHPDIAKPYEIRTFLWFRVGTRTSVHQPADSPLLLPPSMVACSTELPAGSGMVLDTSVARHFGVHPGSTLSLYQNEAAKIDAIVGTVRDLAPTDRAWSSIVIPCAGLDNRTMFHYAGLRLPEREIPEVVRELGASYPALTVVKPREIFAEITNVVGTGATLVRFVSLLAIITGAVVVAGLMAASARQRAGEIAILRALGASRFFVLRMMICEFGALGSIAGSLGGLAGILLINAFFSLSLQKRILIPHLSALGLAMLSGIVLGAAAGSLSCMRVIRERPFVTLRQS